MSALLIFIMLTLFSCITAAQEEEKRKLFKTIEWVQVGESQEKGKLNIFTRFESDYCRKANVFYDLEAIYHHS